MSFWMLALWVVAMPALVRPMQVPVPPAGGRVLVMPFAVDARPDAPGGPGAAIWLGEAAAVLLSDGLASRGLSALPRVERLAAFDQLDLPMSPTLTRATMIRVGELVGASAVVFGEVSLSDRLVVRARLIDLAAAAERAPVLEAAGLADLVDVFDRTAGKLAIALGGPVVGPDEGAVWASLEAFENYVKGLVAVTPEAQQRFLELAMVQAPGDGRILLELWRVYSTLGLHDKALEAASAVRPDAPTARQARFAVARSLIELGRLDGASRELSTQHGQRPSAMLANALGVIELRRAGDERRRSAVRHFEEAASLEPSNTDYRFNLGYAHARGDEADAALASLREVVRLDAADADAHVVMSAVLSSAGRSAEARRERELAVWLGALPESGADVATVPGGLERLPDRLEVDAPPGAASLREHPGQGDVRATAAYHLDRGRALVEARRDREAIAELRRAIYLDPYADEPHLLLATVYQRGGRLTEAIDEFRVALWARETVDGQVALGRALLESGDRDGARRAARRALEIDPQSVDARELLDRIGG